MPLLVSASPLVYEQVHMENLFGATSTARLLDPAATDADGRPSQYVDVRFCLQGAKTEKEKYEMIGKRTLPGWWSRCRLCDGTMQ